MIPTGHRPARPPISSPTGGWRRGACTTIGGVDIEILVDNVSVYSALHFDATPGSFDMTLGSLSPGTTIDVAVGPNGFDRCDATDLDFTLQRTT